jgi:hypothetical protein
VVAGLLQTALARHSRPADLGEAVSRIAARSPEGFCPAALSLLDSATEPSVKKKVYQQLVECPEFLIRLMQPGCFSRVRLLEICRELLALDPTLDVRLARLTPARWQNDSSLDEDGVVQVLDILNEISEGGRLILLLNHLTRHPNRHIASKATLLIGKRLRNQNWVNRQLESADERIRANVVEGLWDVTTPAARQCLWNGLKDKNNRVVGNALLGLHQLGEHAVFEFVKRMIEDPRPPFRWTAAWVMGKMGGEEFVEPLERALQDEDAQVRRSAERALAAIRPPVSETPRQEERAPEAPPAETPAAEQTPTTPVQPPKPEVKKPTPEKHPAGDDVEFEFIGKRRR